MLEKTMVRPYRLGQALFGFENQPLTQKETKSYRHTFTPGQYSIISSIHCSQTFG